jgi:hypothetical protein
MTRPCVRCGRAPRVEDSYLCDQCRQDWTTELEVATAYQEAARTGSDPRRFVLERYRWAGGWRIGERVH